ncbi:MAG: arginine deiminase-related protein, partial [Flavitalea sp.]
MHTTSHLLMIRPVQFSYNKETAVNNAFQVAGKDTDVQLKALEEFDAFVKVLIENGVDVMVINDTVDPYTPDSVFPNNWVSFHNDGTIVLYPMYAFNRRQERKPKVLEQIKKRFSIRHVIDLSNHEHQHKFLEGTGSMVLDRDKNIAYACLSPRTDKDLLDQFCEAMNYHAVPFSAFDINGCAIYHTNVMMCVADRYVVICINCIDDKEERKMVSQTIINSGKEIIEISMDQLNEFAGN